MWIRSQDKSCLIHADEICIGYYGRTYDYQIRGDGSILGCYETEEKALKVLDMINHYLDNGGNYVFHMPQDEDVEILEC